MGRGRGRGGVLGGARVADTPGLTLSLLGGASLFTYACIKYTHHASLFRFVLCRLAWGVLVVLVVGGRVGRLLWWSLFFFLVSLFTSSRSGDPAWVSAVELARCNWLGLVLLEQAWFGLV